MDLLDLSSRQLKRAAAIKGKIAALTKELTGILGNSRTGPAIKKRRTMSAAARKRIATAQKARWAKMRGNKAVQNSVKRNWTRKRNQTQERSSQHLSIVRGLPAGFSLASVFFLPFSLPLRNISAFEANDSPA